MKPCLFSNILLCVPALLALAGPSAFAAEGDSFRAIVRAADEAWLSSELGLPVDLLPLKEGQSFRKGDLLVSFDCSSVEAQLSAADAKVAAAALTAKNNKQLKAGNAIGQYDVDLSKVNLDQVIAEREAVAINLKRCDVKAPFDGIIGQVGVHLYETPDRNARILQILNTTTLEVDMIVPSDWLKWLKPGASFAVSLEELGQTIQGKVSRLAASIDPVSQTLKVVGVLTGDVSSVRPGMSGIVDFGDGK